jgi:hypothetical protein
VSLKMTAFWDIAPCSLVEVDRRFRGQYYLSRPDYGGSTHIRNIRILRHYIVLYPRRLSFSYSMLGEPELSRKLE